jgi:hypothetical protein
MLCVNRRLKHALGEYQYDIYRMMRKHNGDSWEAYRPLTNVMVTLPAE